VVCVSIMDYKGAGLEEVVGYFFFRNSHRNVNFKRCYPAAVFICFLITNAKRYYAVPLQFFI